MYGGLQIRRSLHPLPPPIRRVGKNLVPIPFFFSPSSSLSRTLASRPCGLGLPPLPPGAREPRRSWPSPSCHTHPPRCFATLVHGSLVRGYRRAPGLVLSCTGVSPSYSPPMARCIPDPALLPRPQAMPLSLRHLRSVVRQVSDLAAEARPPHASIEIIRSTAAPEIRHSCSTDRAT